MRWTKGWMAVVGAAVLAVSGSFAGCGGGSSSPSSPSGGAVLRGRLVGGAARVAVVRAVAPGAPIAGAEILLDGEPTGVTTDADGAFTLTLPPGNHTISASTGGAASGSMAFDVAGVNDLTVDFQLNPDGSLTTHDDVNKDGRIDANDDIDDDGDVDDDDADGDIDDDGNVDVGDDNGNDNGSDDSGDDNGSDDGADDNGSDDGSDDSGKDDAGDDSNDN